ncbi:type II toxin-antitoxin system RelE/ParE family toxin [Leifsonia shinshuensis]|uniref:Putative component of toxin-antitoxin plasmid stabilization module n=1 Tax=Leifsonia shinshuensis TaxID=150026 RepID=A0A853CWN7_9MICO|nr:type II toxin-antitoxin system RelE/ParE family toxin [Leifsonia shinshuensis]NYJ24882.1 putative component of toxin-antitoxin plasmid stabilization module [Leifsonia shinshuensis]
MPDDEVDLSQWDYALSARDDAYVLKELRKLKASSYAVGKLERAMERVQKGTAKPGECGPVRGDVWELRVNYDNRWYRLLYARTGDRFVALYIGAKKTNKLDPSWTDTAEGRLKEHRSRQ